MRCIKSFRERIGFHVWLETIPSLDTCEKWIAQKILNTAMKTLVGEAAAFGEDYARNNLLNALDKAKKAQELNRGNTNAN